MPRDDLSIDFVRKMPAEALDPGLILEDWIHRTQNLPDEIRFIQDEIYEKDRLFEDNRKSIEDWESRIQKWVRTRGSHEPNPHEDELNDKILAAYNANQKLSDDKIALVGRLDATLDKHMRILDVQIKTLQDRGEPSFTNPDDVPSLLRGSAASHSAPTVRSINLSANPISPAAVAPAGAAAGVAIPVNPVPPLPAGAAVTRAPNPQMRAAQAQPVHIQARAHAQAYAASAPPTPGGGAPASHQSREQSAGPPSKRGPRANTSLANISTAPGSGGGGNFARHSSLGPGTPGPGANSARFVRAGSAGPPRAGSVKGGTGAGVRKSTPGAGVGAGAVRKRMPKSSLSRVKKSNKSSPASAAESELSDAASGSADDDDAGPDDPPIGGLASGPTGREDRGRDDGDEEMADFEDDEATDDNKYCMCQSVSYGDMVACDNDNCPYEWFHWSCVNLKSRPTGKWYCPVCSEQAKKSTK